MIRRTILLLLFCLSAVPAIPATAQIFASDLFFSEYIEGSSFNKALEIYNGTGGAIDLSAGSYQIQVYFNGNTSPGTTISLAGVVAPGDVFVFAEDSADPTILAVADLVSGASLFNGDDAIALVHNGSIIDVIGQIGFDPGSQWGSGDASTADNTLRRMAAICAGDANPSDAFDPAIEWDGFPNNTFDGLGVHDTTCGGGPLDIPPQVNSTIPDNGATDVAQNADVVVNFSEAVTLSGAWFDITCTTSGLHSAVVTGGPQIYTLDPDVDFSTSEDCTLTVFANQVADQDGMPDNMAANVAVTFSTEAAFVCGDSATLIHDIQGAGTASPLEGSIVTVEGVVTGDFQTPSVELRGFYMQEEDADVDADPLTSEGIFVFDNGFADVNEGDLIRIRAEVDEFSGLTELTDLARLEVCANNVSVTAATVTLPIAAVADFERYEGMLVNFPQTLTVTENFSLGRFGEVLLSVNGRLPNPTNIVSPGAPAIAQMDINARSQIVLDDYNTQQNRDPILYPEPVGLTADNSLRNGYTIENFTAILDFRFGVYRLQPVEEVDFVVASNPRTAEPSDVGGSLKVASFNVLNYFNGDGLGGGFPTSRGADSAVEFERQRGKIVSAIVAMDADIVGLIEIENNGYGPTSAIQDLVNGVNSALGNDIYTFIDPGVAQIGTDEISVGFIYNQLTVEPVSSAAILDSSIDPDFNDDLNRPALAQTFREIATYGEFTAVINHFKSKGSACDDFGDPDVGDGQGNCNVTRTNAATALVEWLATDPTNSGDPDFLIIGDLNSYAKEDPIAAIKSGSYTNLLETFIGEDAYSFVFFGEAGYLDHALSNSSLTPQVTGATEWHINADEPPVLDYNVEFKSSNQLVTLYSDLPYRSSDHDPIVVGLALEPPRLEVVIDIQPLSPFPNVINLNVDGPVWVAIFSSPEFDAGLIDVDSILFAGAAPSARNPFAPKSHLIDINRDQLVDKLVRFEISDLELDADATEATLIGETLSGVPFTGTDDVRVIPVTGPFLISPLNGRTVFTDRPLLVWLPKAVRTCYQVQINDAPFTADDQLVVQEATVVNRTFYRADALASGVYHWRVRVGGNCNIEPGPWSAVWTFRVR